MSLAANQIASHPPLLDVIRAQSRSLLQVYSNDARLASVFATQQRWLLAHAALALYFRQGPANRLQGVTLGRFFEEVAGHAIASRNTADAFMKEMVRYDIVRHVDGTDKRSRPMVPAEATLGAITGWTCLHLSTLDQIDQGRRLQTFLGTEHAIWQLQPAIAKGLLTSPAVREPKRTFSLFTWLDNGGIIMEWLISGLGDVLENSSRISTPVFSIADMAPWLNLSRTHLRRKLREAEALGSLGWDGQRGASAMWVSKDFLDEMLRAQAVKLAVIDAAFDVSLGAGDQMTLKAATAP